RPVQHALDRVLRNEAPVRAGGRTRVRERGPLVAETLGEAHRAGTEVEPAHLDLLPVVESRGGCDLDPGSLRRVEGEIEAHRGERRPRIHAPEPDPTRSRC